MQQPNNKRLNNKFPFVVLNGFQRSGKTTLGNNLERVTNAEYCEGTRSSLTNPSDQYFAYLYRNILTGGYAEKVCQEKPFIANRYIFLTKAFAEYKQGLAHNEMLWMSGLKFPDLEIVLDIDEETFNYRFAKTKKPIIDNFSVQKEVQKRLLAYLDDFNIPFLLIDSAKHTELDVLKLSIDYINAWKRV